MLDDPVKREGVKALGATGAVVAGGPVAATLSVALGIAVEALGYLGEKRTKELFDSQRLVDTVIGKIKQSDDFAAFTFDVWQRHNLESSEQRRKWLKRLLETEAYREHNEFANFSKIEHIMQNVSLSSLKLLSIIHSDVVRKRKIDPADAADRHLNLKKLVPLVQGEIVMHEQDIQFHMSELSTYGLIMEVNNVYGGPVYIEAKLGYIFMDYIRE